MVTGIKEGASFTCEQKAFFDGLLIILNLDFIMFKCCWPKFCVHRNKNRPILVPVYYLLQKYFTDWSQIFRKVGSLLKLDCIKFLFSDLNLLVTGIKTSASLTYVQDFSTNITDRLQIFREAQSLLMLNCTKFCCPWPKSSSQR